MAPTHLPRWFLAASTLVCALFQAQLRAQTIRWQPDVASDAWRTHSKQTGGGTRNTVEQAVVRGKPCLLLHDNDPKLSTNLDTTLDLPDSGLVKGLTLFPATHGDQPNRPNAYLALQLFPKTGGTSIFLTFRRADGTVTVHRRQNDEREVVAKLVGVMRDDVWVPWQIAWQWDEARATGRFRVCVFDRETAPIEYDGGRLNMLRFVSGWSTATANAVCLSQLQALSHPTPLTAELPDAARRRHPFTVSVKRTVLADTFDTPDPQDQSVPAGWYNWKPETDPGRFVFDHQSGRHDTHSLRLASTHNAVWQRKLPARPGAMYRFSAWVNMEQDAPGAAVRIAMQPRGIIKTTGKESWLSGHAAPHERPPAPGTWQYLETFWTAPDSGSYADGDLTLVDIELFGKRVGGNVRYDDARLDEVSITGPWYDAFSDAKETLGNWAIYAWRGLEGQAKCEHLADGFGDPGALRVRHLRGQPGFSAARLLSRSLLGPLRDWTLLAHAEGRDGSTAMLAVEQLDGQGKVLAKTMGDGPGRFPAGWRRRKVTFRIVPKAVSVRLLLLNDGTGSAVFDNAWLRPAQADELKSEVETHPVMIGLFPADVVAAIDQSPASLAFPSGQANAWVLHLYGDKETKADTTVRIDTPSWLTVLTAQQATYGKEPLPFASRKGTDPGRTVHEFKNPYAWQRAQMGTKPNPYTGLLLVCRADAPPETEATVTIQSTLGDQTGQERTVKLVVREPIPKVPSLKAFHVGIWGLGWLHVRDPEAHRSLLQTYLNAGVRSGSMHETHGFAVPTMRKTGFTPTMIIHSPSSPLPYRSLPADKRPPFAVLADGKNTHHFIALGAALNDPKVHAHYRRYLARYLRGYPDFAHTAILDIEFWGDGSVSRSDFHETTVAEFRRRQKIPADTPLTAATILKDHYEAWSAFRNALTAELHGVTRRILREVRPDMQLWAYDYPLGEGGAPREFVTESPMDTKQYEPHIDGHLISYYNLEGTRFLDAVDNDVKHLTKPIHAVPFLMKNISNIYDTSYNYAQISARELRFEIVAAAASAAAGHVGFPGKLMDADYLHAYAEGVAAVAACEAFYAQGTRNDRAVAIRDAPPTVRHRVHDLNGQRLVTLFNGGTKPVTVKWTVDGTERSTAVQARDFHHTTLP